MRVNNFAHNRQPQTGAVFFTTLPGCIHLVKAIKYMRLGCLGNSNTIISHAYIYKIPLDGGFDGDSSTCRGKFERIIHQIVENLCETIAITDDIWQVL